MAAPKGNNFWEIASKHGRDKLFATPELMWEAACEYFQWCIENPLMMTESKVISSGNNQGSEIAFCEVPKIRPFTLHGLCSYLNCSTGYFRTFKSTIKPENKVFLAVIEKIEETVYNQKFSGAAAGFLNANLISRDLGLAEKREIENRGDVSIRVVYEDEYNNDQAQAPPPSPETDSTGS